MTRPLIQKSLDELQNAVRRNQHHRAELSLIEAELRHRKTPAARKLQERVREHLLELEKTGLRHLGKAPSKAGGQVPANAGKYRDVHAKAEAAGSPVVLGWKHANTRFVPGTSKQGGTSSAYGTIRAICREAGAAGSTGITLATELRKRQVGNGRSSYCNGMPPIGWAEGWIDTAVTSRLIVPISLQDSPVGSPDRIDELPPQFDAVRRDMRAQAQPSDETRQWTEKAVADLRTKLIDLSKKSSLVSFKHGGRSASILRLVDERPDLLFRAIESGSVGFEPLPGQDDTPKDELTNEFRIAYERARLTDGEFLAATEKLGDDERDARAWQEAERALRARVRQQLGLPALDYGKALNVTEIARAHGFDPTYDLKASDDDDVAPHHEDDSVRVLLTAKELDKRLKTIWERYRGHARETGLHTLFLVLGFVQWFDEASPDTPLHAPLLSLAVELERKVVRGRYEYTLKGHDEGLQVNIALAEKMRQHWGLELPPLRDGESPESYFIRMEGVLEKGQRLSLRRFATLAVLPFPRMVLWKDLDPAAWTDGAFAQHRLLPALLGAAQIYGEPGDTIDIEAPEWAEKAPALVRPADASQHSALIDMAGGHDLAIEGPPGTGKSETITNMIATAVGAGKKVLFVAEKQAALRVVADRLRATGLGPLLLELHGDNANRTEIYDSLRHRHPAPRISFDSGKLGSQRQQLRQRRDLLRRYLALINSKLGVTGHTAYWLAWREIRLRDGVDRAMADSVRARWRPEAAKTIDPVGLADRRARLDQFGEALLAIEREASGGGRTRWTIASRLDPFDQRPQLRAAASAASAAAAMAAAQSALDALAPLDLPVADGPIEAAAEQLAVLSGFEPVGEALARSALRDSDTARALLRQQARWRQLCGKLHEDVRRPEAVSDVAVAELAAALEEAQASLGTVADLHAKLEELEGALLHLKQVGGEMEKTTRTLKLDPGMGTAALRRALEAVMALEREPATVAALYRADLVDPIAEAALHEERTRAASLRDERSQLASLVEDEAMETEPAELNRLADILAESGAFARFFGGEFKSARRRVRRLVRSPGERAADAELLRRLGRWKQQLLAFRTDSAVASWFPTVLWKGIDSDWVGIQRARFALIDARQRLAEAGADETLSAWLRLSPEERVRVAAGADRIVPVLTTAETLGTSDVQGSELMTWLTLGRDRLARLDQALVGVDALPAGHLTRDGEDLATRLAALHVAAAEFDRLRTRSGFEWVEEIGASLDALARALSHAEGLRAAPGPLAVVAALIATEAPVELLDAILGRREAWLAASRAWAEEGRMRLEAATGFAATALASQWEELAKRLSELAEDEAGARLAADLQRYGRALDEVGLRGLGEFALRGEADPARLADLYELLFLRALLSEYLGGDGAELGRLGSLTLENARKEFTRIDKELHDLEARAILVDRLRDKAPAGIGYGPKSQYTDMSLLESELALKKPRTPIRDVVHRAGGALQVLKPVWMMSPASAAQYIRPGSLKFDLLVIDEASQMRPEFSVSAVLRGQQFVVVGDANQLPPSDHFQMSSDDSDEEGSVAQDTESILDLANQRLPRKRRLKWHYRSQHESLIQFSNRQFYERDLVVFPSPMGNDDELLGVKCVYVPELYPDTIYEASINQREAEAVIQEAFRLMQAYPDHSMGIAAMNAKQTELIQNEFDRLILEQPQIRRYVEEFAGGLDEFFIKNLENVQGDERDIILISTVYGPGKDGKVNQWFGLMNREVGWRRLNVLVTRAKLSTRLFTSLRPDDIKVTSTSSRGVQAFKAYLTYAHQGAAYDDTSGGEPDSDFEIFVADALREVGYEVVHQVGVEGFRIDLGVRHPDYPIGFIAGIECDGASFHSGLTVRDRDRIRQSVLEKMGWRIYRIWSTDWFADPERETRKLLAWLDEHRLTFASEYARRPKPGPTSRSGADKAEPVPLRPIHPSTPATPPPRGLTPSFAPTRDRFRPDDEELRTLDDFHWSEGMRGHLYEIWLPEGFAGEVEVLRRATGAARLYGGQAVVPRSEYEGWVEATDARFKTDDMYAAMREVARRARVASQVPKR